MNFKGIYRITIITVSFRFSYFCILYLNSDNDYDISIYEINMFIYINNKINYKHCCQSVSILFLLLFRTIQFDSIFNINNLKALVHYSLLRILSNNLESKN